MRIVIGSIVAVEHKARVTAGAVVERQVSLFDLIKLV